MSRLVFARGIWETAKISVPTLLDAALRRTDMRACDARVLAWSRRLLAQGRLSVDIQGREHLGTGETFIVMSNHQSLYDIPILFLVFEGETLRMVTKAELFKIPLWGRAMREAGFISIDRGDSTKAIASLQEAKATLARGVHVWLAPEGTRSRTGVLGPFKHGGFHLAIQTGKRILPVTINGSGAALRADTLDVRDGTAVQVRVSEPIDPADYGSAGRDALRYAVRRAIAEGLPAEQRGVEEEAG